MTDSTGASSRRGRPPVWIWLVAAALVAVLIFLAAAWTAGKVPGQPEATRVPVTPFADIPGFTPPTPVP